MRTVIKIIDYKLNLSILVEYGYNRLRIIITSEDVFVLGTETKYDFASSVLCNTT